MATLISQKMQFLLCKLLVIQRMQITSGFHCTIYKVVVLGGIILFVFVLPVPVQIKHRPLLLKL